MRILIVLIVLFCGCGPKKVMDSTKIEKQNNSRKSANEFGEKQIFPDSPIQSDTSKNHHFNGINLIKDHNGIYHSLNLNGYIYSERFPGILNVKNLRQSKIERLQFHKENKLIKSVSLADLNPFLKKYKDIRTRYPNFEEFNMPDNKFQYREPDDFLTFYDFGQTSLNGFTIVTYFLAPIVKNTKLPWETISLILDKNGKVIQEHKEKSDIIPALVSDDGKLFGYSYAVNPDNPGNLNKETTFKVIDFDKGEVVLELKGGASASDTEPGLISRISGYSKTQKRKIEFLSLNERIIYTKEFTKKQFNEAWNLYESWLEILINDSFEQKSF